ncbi:Nose resistant to fluoxetine protein 6 [Holothuria leucospilota]|uniref:Nose resistant to fluoxetine protein 6 n=1 Tax=Holothuria leucospilota TaxID=206669 RepID=A0A9Q0YGT0_HOLLE|nr:Nose resistant to fluoxetine protein 6 [Holothuria leucospilota]
MVGINAGIYFTCITDIPWTGDAIFVLFLLCLFGACVLIGTTYDVFYRRLKLTATPKDEGKHKRLNETEEHNVDEVQHLSKEEAGNEGQDEKEGEGTTGKSDGPVEKTNETFEEAKDEPQPPGRRRRGVLAGILDGILMSFSCVNNGLKILNCEKTAGNLGALNGIRVISMFWIIWGHTNQFLLFGRLDNPFDVLTNVLGQFWFRITTEATFSVDTFFVLSGLLLTYLTLKHLAKSEGKLNWFLFVFHRFWRITPLYMVCIGIWSSLLVHIGTGPDKEEFYSGVRATCADYWWANLLYINNLVPYPGSVNLCMGWSWYLANDMQFFLLSPIFLILLSRPKWRKIGIGSVIGVAITSCLITAVVAGYWGYPVGNYPQPFNNRTATQPADADRIYAKPWCRIQSYMVGIFVGYLLYSVKDQKMKIPLIWNLLGWILSLGVMFTLIFSLYGSSHTDPLPNWFAALWLGFNRFIFSSCVGWVAFACLTGNGGPVDAFLSWGFWQPLSRLTFGAYLLHPMVIFLFVKNQKTSFHWTILDTGFFCVANIVVSYGWAFVLSLLVEGPMMGIEKALLKRSK